MSTHTPITGQELLEMKRRCEKATAGPWLSSEQYGRRYILNYYNSILLSGNGERTSSDDFLFAAHARTDLPRCLAQVEAMQVVLRSVLDACTSAKLVVDGESGEEMLALLAQIRTFLPEK